MSVTVDGVSPADASEKCSIGISFGNSYSSIAYTSTDGKVVVIANEEGDRQIPSILSYIEGEEYHGAQAKAQLVRNSANTVAYFRDFIGKDFSTIDTSHARASAPPSSSSNAPAYTIHDTSSSEPSTVTVSDIATRHLKRLVRSASDFLGKPVESAVIAVPPDFTAAQKDALRASAAAAGLEVRQQVDEPLAALLAYERRPDVALDEKTILVADLGGTRADAAVVAARGGLYTVLASASDGTAGGVVLDEVLIDYFAKEFVKKSKTADPRDNARSRAKMRLEAEATKKALSLGTNASFSIEGLAEGRDFSANVNRTRYELLASKALASFTRLAESAVRKADLDALDIDLIVLAGGTAHTPKVASNLAALFPKATVLAPSASPAALNPSELAARGAAVQAALLRDMPAADRAAVDDARAAAERLHLRHPIGVLLGGAADARFRPVLLGQTAVPARRAVVFAAPGPGDVRVRVCEGASHVVVSKPEPKAKADKKAKKDNDSEDDDDDDESEEEETREKVWKIGTMLGELTVPGVPKKGQVEVEVDVGQTMGAVVRARAKGADAWVELRLDQPGGEGQSRLNGSA